MESEEFVQSRTVASELVDQVRRAASALVDREERRLCSRMLAYEVVGQMVGASPMWVRRFVNEYEYGALNYVVGCNILLLHQRYSSS
jgi:hypothetical protein